MALFTLPAPAGSGKTRSCARHADRLAPLGHKVLFVQPTQHLITKTEADELQPLVPPYLVTALHGGTLVANASVLAAVVAHFRNAPHERGVLKSLGRHGTLMGGAR